MKHVFLPALLCAALLQGAGFKAGVAKVVITPKAPIRMSGYASRNRPSEGVVHDLWAKALALEDSKSGRLVIVTFEVMTIPRPVADEVAARVGKQYGLARERLLLNCSHTHSGPVLRPNAYALPEAEGEDARVVDAYTTTFIDSLVKVIGMALDDLSPARLSLGHGQAGFAANRREPTPKGYKIGVNPDGPVDHDVPVLRVTAPDGRIRAILFGYACHNTTMGGDFYKLSGDYAGFAQIELEKSHPGAAALFLQLCGADQNPNPRGTLELAERYGKELAAAVEGALSGRLKNIRPPIRAALETTELAFAPHTRETFAALVNDRNTWRARHARRMLQTYDEGHPIHSVRYPVQAVRFAKDLTLIALGGEVVVDYDLRAKREFRGEDLIVAGYSNDVMCYIPSKRMLKEGGYEPVDSLIYDGMPGPFSDEVEETVFRTIRAALKKVGR